MVRSEQIYEGIESRTKETASVDLGLRSCPQEGLLVAKLCLGRAARTGNFYGAAVHGKRSLDLVREAPF